MELTIRQQEKERQKKVYELAKFSLKHLPKGKKRQDVYTEIANEFGYWHWRHIAKIYSNLRKLDKDPLPLFKDNQPKSQKQN